MSASATLGWVIIALHCARLNADHEYIHVSIALLGIVSQMSNTLTVAL